MKEAGLQPVGEHTAIPGDQDLPFVPAAHTHGQASSDAPGCLGPREACGAAEEEEIRGPHIPPQDQLALRIPERSAAASRPRGQEAEGAEIETHSQAVAPFALEEGKRGARGQGRKLGEQRGGRERKLRSAEPLPSRPPALAHSCNLRPLPGMPLLS